MYRPKFPKDPKQMPSAFMLDILKAFMTPVELIEINKKYQHEKLNRYVKRMEKHLEKF